MSTKTVFKKILAAVSIAALSSGIIIGCSSSSTSTTSSSSLSYSGPGSKWDISLTETDSVAESGTFHIDHRPDLNSAIDYTVDGTYTTTNQGFKILEVTGGTGSGGPTVGEKAWAIDVPGYAFMLKPVNGDQLVAMVKSGECPTTDVDANWVMVKKDDNGGNAGADSTTRDFFGTFHYDSGTNTPSLPIKKALSSGFPDVSGGGISAGSCADGIMSVSGAAMYLTSNGGAIVHTGVDTSSDETDDSFIFALGQKDITNVNNLDGTYAGMLFDDNASNGSKINGVTFSCTSGTCTGTMLSDVEAGTSAAGTATVTLSGGVDSIASGMITGTISDGSGTGNLACTADINALSSGKKIISCVGQSPAVGEQAKMFNVLFVSNS